MWKSDFAARGAEKKWPSSPCTGAKLWPEAHCNRSGRRALVDLGAPQAVEGEEGHARQLELPPRSATLSIEGLNIEAKIVLHAGFPLP